MLGRPALYQSLVILLMIIHKLHGSTLCSIFRNARDNITPQTCLAPAKDVCQSLGAVVKDPWACKCICPRNKGTYMENTQKCSAKNEVWSGCNIRLKGPSWSIPVFRLKTSTAAEVIVPYKFRKCKISIDTSKSFYLYVNGWKKIDKKGFPFQLSYERQNRKLKLKWTKSKNHRNSIVRLQIKITCKRVQKRIITDCLLFKVFSGRISYPCSLPIPTTTMKTTVSTTTISTTITNNETATADDPVQNISNQANMTKPSNRPSVVVDKGKRGSSSNSELWVIIGPIIGVIALLIVFITIMFVCFWRIWKKKLKNKYSNATSSSFIHNSTPSTREVTYSSPHHPYQDLRPPVRGAPPGVYQPLNNKAKEDASGYLLPVLPNAETSREADQEPIYNEIGSPKLLPTYDYALPEDTIRLSIQSLDDNVMNDPTYVGRPSKEQEGPNSNGALTGMHSVPIQRLPSDEVGEPGYLELNGVTSLESRTPAVVNTYQDPIPWRHRGHKPAE